MLSVSSISPASGAMLMSAPPGFLKIQRDMRREESGLYPEQAAQMWPKLVEAAQKLNLRLGSPAAAPCGANCMMRNPFEW